MIIQLNDKTTVTMEFKGSHKELVFLAHGTIIQLDKSTTVTVDTLNTLNELLHSVGTRTATPSDKAVMRPKSSLNGLMGVK